VEQREPIYIQLAYPIYKQDYMHRSINPKGSRFTLEHRPTDTIYRIRLTDGPKPKDDGSDLRRWLDSLDQDDQ
jgi:hypothetical protein